MNIFSNFHTLIDLNHCGTILLIGLNHCETILWKYNPHKMVEHTLIPSNKRMSTRDNVQK